MPLDIAATQGAMTGARDIESLNDGRDVLGANGQQEYLLCPDLLQDGLASTGGRRVGPDHANQRKRLGQPGTSALLEPVHAGENRRRRVKIAVVAPGPRPGGFLFRDALS